MKRIYFLLAIIFVANNVFFANVPPPPRPGSKGIHVQKDYPEYVFYFGKYYVFEEKGKSISKIDLEQIELANLRPFAIKEPKNFDLLYLKEKNLNADQVKFSAREDYLIAVKKEVHDQIKTKLGQKMIELINLKKDGDVIYYAAIPQIGIKVKPGEIRYGSYDFRMVVESIDENGLKFQVVRFQEGDNHFITDSDGDKRVAERNIISIALLVGIGLGLTAVFTTLGIYLFKRKQKMQ